MRLSTVVQNLPRNVAIGMLLLYKRWLSPLFPNTCRFTPTCSEYTAQAISTFGIMRGSAMGLYRIMRCNPFSRGGYDPVPEKPACKHSATHSHL